MQVEIDDIICSSFSRFNDVNTDDISVSFRATSNKFLDIHSVLTNLLVYIIPMYTGTVLVTSPPSELH